MIKLHYFPGNASFAPHVMLRHLGLEFELVHVDRNKDAHKSAEYLQLNPAGRIPTYVDGDLILTESAAICLHLADTNKSAGMAPEIGTAERAKFYKWMMFLTNTIQPDILMYYYNHRYTSDPDGGPAVQKAAARRLMQWFQIVEDALIDSPFFMGENFSVLDIYLLMLARWGRPLETAPRDMTKINTLCRRVLAQPAVIATIKAEGITGDFLN